MQLGETVSIDGGTLVLILVVLGAIALLGIAAVLLGFIWAYRAGQGSRGALIGWAVIGLVELLYATPVLFGAMGRSVNGGGLLPLAALAAQVALYFRGRADGPPPPKNVAPEGDPTV